MKRSSLFHRIAMVAVVLGSIAFLGAVITPLKKILYGFGFGEDELFVSGIVLLFVSIAVGIGALYHQHAEDKK